MHFIQEYISAAKIIQEIVNSIDDSQFSTGNINWVHDNEEFTYEITQDQLDRLGY